MGERAQSYMVAICTARSYTTALARGQSFPAVSAAKVSVRTSSARAIKTWPGQAHAMRHASRSCRAYAMRRAVSETSQVGSRAVLERLSDWKDAYVQLRQPLKGTALRARLQSASLWTCSHALLRHSLIRRDSHNLLQNTLCQARCMATIALGRSAAETEGRGPLDEYDERVHAHRLRDDEHQRNIVHYLQDLHDELVKYASI